MHLLLEASFYIGGNGGSFWLGDFNAKDDAHSAHTLVPAFDPRNLIQDDPRDGILPARPVLMLAKAGL